MLQKKYLKSDTYSYFLFFSQCLAFIFLGSLFFLFGYDSPLSSYDIVRNHQVISSFLEGDFSSIFSHFSPLFFLVYWPFYAVIDRPEIGMWVNGLFLLLHLMQWTSWITKHWEWKKESKIAFILFYGTSYFLLSQAQAISVEPLSLLLFGLFWEKQQNKSFYAWPLFALMSLVNYKALLLFPFFIVIPLITSNIKCFSGGLTPCTKRLLSSKTFIIVIFTVFFTTSFLLALGYFSGAGTLNYFARAYGLITARAIQKAPLDFFFYFKYILHFENLLLPLGLLLGLGIGENFLKSNILFFSFLVFFFVLMCLLPKAPRGLLFILPLLYAWAWKGLLGKQKKPSLVLYITLSISLFFAVNQAYTQLYFKNKSGLKEMAECLHDLKLKKVNTTRSLQIWPEVKSTIKVNPILNFSDFKDVKYLLFDDYWHATQSQAPVFPEAEILCRVPVPELHNPMLYLGHCEFSNRTFAEAMEAWKTHYAPEVRLLRLTPKNETN